MIRRLFQTLILVAAARSLIAVEPGEGTDRMETAKTALKEHYEYQKLIARERADWEVGKDLIESRIVLLRDQIAEYGEKSAEQAAKITEADDERAKLLAEDEELTALQEYQLARVVELEERVRRLLPVLPGVLASKLQALTERLPIPDKAPEDIKSSMAERFQNAVGILNEINKFNNDLTVVNERRGISGGREAEVQALYYGLSLAFYAGIGNSASEAGRGVPGKDGWEWTPMPEEAERIATMIAMVEKSSSAEYVPLPVSVD